MKGNFLIFGKFDFGILLKYFILNFMQNKVVVITGASSGIGKALAEKYASEGWNLVLAARRIDRLKALEKQLNGVEVLSVETDVGRQNDCQNLVELAIGKFGKIDVLINNAGISMRASLEEVDLDVMQKVMDVNYWGTVYCSKYALPHLVKSKGSLVGVISVAGYVGLPGEQDTRHQSLPSEVSSKRCA